MKRMMNKSEKKKLAVEISTAVEQVISRHDKKLVGHMTKPIKSSSKVLAKKFNKVIAKNGTTIKSNSKTRRNKRVKGEK